MQDVEEVRDFRNFAGKAGWTSICGTERERPLFELWKRKVKKAKVEKVIIESYLTHLKSRIEGDKRAANLEWEAWLLDGYVSMALTQKPPVPWESPEETWNEVARVCGEVYGVLVDPKDM